MAKIKIAVNGAAGRMGRRVIALIGADEECELVCALEREDSAEISRDAGELAGTGRTGVGVSAGLCGDPDVLIDFSTPDSCLGRLRECAGGAVAAVVGTTGFDPEGGRKLEDFAKLIPVLAAPNMSVGMNLMFRLAAQAAAMLGKGYDIEIIESHHRDKKDAPSGTALKLAGEICEARGRRPDDVLVYGRHGVGQGRLSGQVGVHAVRGGGIVGEHTVLYAGDVECLQLTHRAENRDVFAAGAIHAAKFILTRPPGLYGMQDVLSGQSQGAGAC